MGGVTDGLAEKNALDVVLETCEPVMVFEALWHRAGLRLCQGVTRETMLAAFGILVEELRAKGEEWAEDEALAVMDCLQGWCVESLKL